MDSELMNFISIAALIFAAILLITLIVTIIVNRIYARRIFKNLDTMLNSAINGTFSEHIPDESLLSSFELKLGRYLSDCSVNSKKLAEERDKIKSLISDISHQTKTPSANILLYSSLIKEQADLSVESRQMLEIISEQSEKLTFLINSLIKTSRLETGIITVSPQKNSITNLIKALVLQVSEKAKDKNITIDFKDSDVYALFDMKWTSEAIYNILDNAVKYTHQDGKISIEIIPYDIFCRINIKDTGVGIPFKDISKIFQRFYRSEHTKTSEGVGLGLYLSREIISSQGGYIKVNSKVGKGSSFSVFLQQK